MLQRNFPPQGTRILSTSAIQDTPLMKLRRLKALIVKEFFQIIRDISSILISIVLPLVLLFLYGYGMSLDLNHLRIGLVLEDSSPEARGFAQSLTDNPYFDVQLVRDRRELLDRLVEGKIRGFVVVPSYFSAFEERHDFRAPIQVIADGSEPNTANFAQGYVQGAFQNWLKQKEWQQGRFLEPLSFIEMQPRYWYNESVESRYFLLPGSLAIIMTLIGTLLTALVVSREWERGTMEALMSTPVGLLELVAGKVIPYYIMGMISMTICMVISIFLYDLPMRGSILVLAGVTSIFLFCALGLGLLISTIAKNQIIASQMAMVTGFLPAYMLSGFIFEIASMPAPIRMLTYFLPARYFVQSLQTLFLVGNVWSLLLWNIGCMLLMGTVILGITAYKTVKRLD